MEHTERFDTLIVITPKDCMRLLPLYHKLWEEVDYGNFYFVGAAEVGEIVDSEFKGNDRVSYICENDIIEFDMVHKCIEHKMEILLDGRELPRGITGWYYQQFLKMQYALMCKDEYYMVWDGDTIPCRKIVMFQDGSGKPYLDLKHEYHQEYFDTMSALIPGLGKAIERSFISEHMLIRADIMRSLISDIENNDAIEGDASWEKIINATHEEKIQSASVSEF